MRTALGELGNRLHSRTVEGAQLWFEPAVEATEGATRRGLLLPVFDEAYLSFASLNLPRADGHPSATTPHSFAEAGGGVVVLDRRDVGWWKRKHKGRQVDVSLALANSIGTADRELIVSEAERLAVFTDRTPNITISRG